MKAFMRIQMDRPFDPNKHYFSPGGYQVKTKDGKTYGFDFNETNWGVEKEPNIITATVRDEDYDTFPEITELREKLHTVVEIIDFYIYTGEADDPEINPVKILEFAIEDHCEKRSCPPSSEFVTVQDHCKDSKTDSCFVYEFTEKLLDTYSFV